MWQVWTSGGAGVSLIAGQLANDSGHLGEPACHLSLLQLFLTVTGIEAHQLPPSANKLDTSAFRSLLRWQPAVAVKLFQICFALVQGDASLVSALLGLLPPAVQSLPHQLTL